MLRITVHSKNLNDTQEKEKKAPFHHGQTFFKGTDLPTLIKKRADLVYAGHEAIVHLVSEALADVALSPASKDLLTDLLARVLAVDPRLRLKTAAGIRGPLEQILRDEVDTAVGF